MKLHRQKLSEELSHCSPNGQALFAFFCAERLRGCCWTCQATHGIDLAPFFRWLDLLFKLLLNHESLDIQTAKTALLELESLVPGGEPLLVQAQSSIICLMTAFFILANEGQANIIDAVNASVDALDNYEFFVRRRIINDTRNPTEYTLLKREMDRQLVDAAFAKDYEQLPDSVLLEHRIENLEFVIPPAV